MMFSRRQILPLAGLLLLSATAAAAAESLVFDLNKDGRIDRREFVKGRQARFAALDRNKDNVVSSADFPAELRGRPLARKVERLISTADLNRDSKVTLMELQLSGSPVFEEADTNMNGLIEGPEIARFRSEFLPPR